MNELERRKRISDYYKLRNAEQPIPKELEDWMRIAYPAAVRYKPDVIVKTHPGGRREWIHPKRSGK